MHLHFYFFNYNQIDIVLLALIGEVYPPNKSWVKCKGEFSEKAWREFVTLVQAGMIEKSLGQDYGALATGPVGIRVVVAAPIKPQNPSSDEEDST